MAIRRIDQTYTPEAPSSGLMKAAMANPFEGLMKTVEDFATQQGKQNAQQAALTDVMAGKQPGPSIGMTPFGQAYNDAAQKAYEAQTSNDLRAKSIEIASQFSGMKAGDADNADQMMKAHIEGLSKNIPEQFRASVLFEAEARRADLYSKIAGAEKEHQFKMNIEDIKSALDNDLVEAQMRARDGDIAAANAVAAKAQERAQSLVGYGVLTPDRAASSMKEFKDAQGAEEVIGSAIRSGNIMQTVKAVQDGAGRFAETPLKTRKYIINELTQEAYRQQAQQNAGRQAREEKGISLADKINSGKTLNRDEQAERDFILANPDAVSPKTRSDVVIANGADQMWNEIKNVTLLEAQKTVDDWNQQEPTSYEEAQIRKNINTRWEEYKKAMAPGSDEQIDYLTKTGQMSPGIGMGAPTISFESPQALADSIKQQRNVIRTNEAQLDITLPVLRKDEARRFADILKSRDFTPDDKLAMVAAATEALGPKGTITWNQIDKQNGAGLQVVGKVYQQEQNRTLARDILNGFTMIANDVGKAPSLDQMRLSSKFSSINALNSSEQGAYVEAVKAVYVSRNPNLSSKEFDPGKMDEAIAEVIGNTAPVGLMNANNQRMNVLLPKGMDESGWNSVINNLTPEDVVAMGGTGDLAEVISGKKLRDFAASTGYISGANPMRFDRISDGKYHVFDGADAIRDAAGNPFVFDITKVGPVKPGAFSKVLTTLSDTMAAMGESARASEFARFGL